MRMKKRHGVLFLAIAAWNVFSFGNFARNLLKAYNSGEERAPGYWIAHSVLIVVNFAIAAVLGQLGVRVLTSQKKEVAR